MKKITKREKFEMLMAMPSVQENEMLTEFIQNELDLLARKKSGEKKMTTTQIVNEGIKQEILECMEPGVFYTITDMIKMFPACADMSNQRVSALVRQMVPDQIETVIDKRKSYFILAGTAEEVKGE